MSYIMLAIEVILIGLIFKCQKVQRVKLFLERLFWIDKFNGEGFLRKSLLFYGKCSMLLYLFAVISCISELLITFDSWWLFGTFFFGLGMPLGYRLVIGFQRYFHNI